MKAQRDSGIELLRIFAMCMVISIHLFGYGNYFSAATEFGGLVSASAFLLKFLFRPAVDIFIIITGYFMCRSGSDFRKSFNRAFKIYLAVLFYSIVLSIITVCIGGDFLITDGTKNSVSYIVIRMFFPVSGRYWYFLSDYILLMLAVPFVNLVLNGITKKQYICLLAIMTFVLSIWLLFASINPFKNFIRAYNYESLIDGKNIFSFIYMYSIGGYIGLHVKKEKHPKVRYILIAVVLASVNYCIYKYLGEELDYKEVAFLYTNPLVILSAVSIFMFFKDLHFKSKIINLFGSSTIGVYAISEFKFIREWLWNVFDFSKYDCSNLLINFARILGVVALVFIVCSVIELIRQKIFAVIGLLINKIRKNCKESVC